MRRRELAAGVRKRNSRRSIVVVAVIVAFVLLFVIWLALQTLGGHATNS